MREQSRTRTHTHKQSDFVSVVSTIQEPVGRGRESGKTRKYFTPDFPDREENIKREAGNLALALRSGCPVVRLLEHDHESITTEYVAGETLQKVLSRSKIQPIEKIRLLIKALTCIRSFHRAGIVQGDTHPSNFIVTPDGKVVVCDCGLSHSREYQFIAPPPTQAKKDYFSPAQVDAFEHDIAAAERNETCWLHSNDLPPESDFYILGARLIESGAFTADVVKVLKKMTQEGYRDADMIIADLERLIEKETPQPLCSKLFRKTSANSFRPATSTAGDLRIEAPKVRGETAINRFFLKRFIAVSVAGAVLIISGYSLSKLPSRQAAALPVPQVQAAPVVVDPQTERVMREQEELQRRISSLEQLRQVALQGSKEAVRQLFVLRSSQDKAESQFAEKSVGELFAAARGNAGTLEGRRQLTLFVKLGYAPAALALGEVFERGTGMENPDLVEAYGHYRTAKCLGLDDGQKAVGRLEAGIQGLLENNKRQRDGFRLLLASAGVTGNVNAQFYAGRIYEDGVYGVNKDLSKAQHLFELAAGNGHQKAAVHLQRVNGMIAVKRQAYTQKPRQPRQQMSSLQTTGAAREAARKAIWEDVN